ncbi:hypothetical protein ACT691_16255 [Vibrio metschnikovii]
MNRNPFSSVANPREFQQRLLAWQGQVGMVNFNRIIVNSLAKEIPEAPRYQRDALHA